MEKKPKYCEVCGRELVSKFVDCGFDMVTGSKKTREILECPEYSEYDKRIENVLNENKRIREEVDNHNKSAWRRFWNYKSVDYSAMIHRLDLLAVRSSFVNTHTRIEL